MINLLIPERTAIVQQEGHPAAGVIGWLDRGSNTSGVLVTEDVALTYSAVWAANRVISETVATLPCIFYERLASGGKERARQDERFALVHDSPNDIMTAYSFFETGTSHMVLWGNEYSKIVRGPGMSLEIRLPNTVLVENKNDELMYRIDELDERIPASDMLHVAGIGFDGVRGHSVIRMAAQSIGTHIAAEKHAGSFFGNGAVPLGALVHPQRLDKEKRDYLRKSWDEVHKGSDNGSKVAILHGGIEYQQLGMTHDDAQFLESRKFGVDEIARWFRLPPHLIGSLDRATFSNIEQQALEFVKYSITPWLKRWESALNKKLLRTSEKGKFFFEFLVDSLLRGDTETRYNAFATARQWGWLSVNEIRAIENMNPVENGDVYLQSGESSLPETITDAWQTNLLTSLEKIREAGQDAKEHILELGLDSGIERAEQRLANLLSGVRDQQQEIRGEIAKLGGQVQSRGVDVDDLMRSHRACDLAKKSAREMFGYVVDKLAVFERRCLRKSLTATVQRGEDFRDAVNQFYEKYECKMRDAISPCISAWCVVTQEDPEEKAHAVCEAICSSHKNDILSAFETSPDSVADVLTAWADEPYILE